MVRVFVFADRAGGFAWWPTERWWAESDEARWDRGTARGEVEEGGGCCEYESVILWSPFWRSDWAGLDWTGLGGASLVFVPSRGSCDQAELGRGRGETLRWRMHRVGKNDAGGRERRARTGGKEAKRYAAGAELPVFLLNFKKNFCPLCQSHDLRSPLTLTSEWATVRARDDEVFSKVEAIRRGCSRGDIPQVTEGTLLDAWACTIRYGGRQVGSLPGTLQYIDPYPHLPVRDGTLCRRMHVSAGTVVTWVGHDLDPTRMSWSGMATMWDAGGVRKSVHSGTQTHDAIHSLCPLGGLGAWEYVRLTAVVKAIRLERASAPPSLHSRLSLCLEMRLVSMFLVFPTFYYYYSLPLLLPHLGRDGRPPPQVSVPQVSSTRYPCPGHSCNANDGKRLMTSRTVQFTPAPAAMHPNFCWPSSPWSLRGVAGREGPATGARKPTAGVGLQKLRRDGAFGHPEKHQTVHDDASGLCGVLDNCSSCTRQRQNPHPARRPIGLITSGATGPITLGSS
ncbi:hypothetical protein OIDMADRAFT_149850 [Oidiodendron maius Zn]|uniref:Uncharacterized protein n=1 Tax=Oidiodendron maius (strain Zn) TaxID=913774 RepID=A0A0C3GR88_OIDMZ|nr:hypothetical protein OIDMADRAFT_149850 [Oidiodendron maius Zn]